MNQLPGGGFRGGPATNFSIPGAETEDKDDGNERGHKYDPVNLPACYFAIATLVALGDDLERLDRRGLLKVVNRLQREDGSFGECLIRENGQDKVTTGGDMRFVYMAAAVRWLLRGQEGMGCREVPDFEVEKLVGYIRSAQGYDGGVSDRELGESHGGFPFRHCWTLSDVVKLQRADGVYFGGWRLIIPPSWNDLLRCCRSFIVRTPRRRYFKLRRSSSMACTTPSSLRRKTRNGR